MANDHDKIESGDLDDKWLLDDGIGSGLFGGDVWTQLNSGKKGPELDEYIEDIKAGARVAIDQSIGILTPWFFSNMPQFYYQTTPREEKVRDLHAVITGHIFESKQKLQLWNRERSKTTFLAPGNDEAIFMDIAESISDLNVKHGAMYTSNDRLLLISSFFTEKFKPVDQKNEKSMAKIQNARKLLSDYDAEVVDDFLENLDHDMVVHATPPRLARIFKVYELAKDREDAVTHLIPKYFNEFARMDIAFKKMSISKVLPSLLSIFERYGFQVNRTVLATVNPHRDTPVTIMTVIFRHEEGKNIDDTFVPFLKLNKAAKSLRWVDVDHFDAMWKVKAGHVPSYSLNEINLIRSISIWTQIFLSKLNPYYYSEERIRKTFTRNPEALKKLVYFFRVRFDPRFSTKDREKVDELVAEVRADIAEIPNRIEHDIFIESLNFLTHILKTNYFYPRKTGLSFRMDPSCLNQEHYPNRPYGFFFMVGRGYRGFQVRYRDTARGGMRIVMPQDTSQYEVAFAGLFDEVVGLSYAQQLKNKDIPEGGAKAVLLLAPGADRETAAIGAVDSILNLITTDPDTKELDESVIDYYGQPEYIYLGPDENCTNELIEAFVDQAKRQGYRYANAFMSSKPKAGINHKEYGVTSEGVNVFLDNMLKELGIDPKKQSFTVKMTGGPDGDVAGNELKILFREYGENAKVLGIGDGFGAAYDPEGLQWKELLRLVEEGLSIDRFSKDALSKHKDAFVLPATTPENIKLRNTLHAWVEADIFIPAGGRPYTVNDDNWNKFIKEDGSTTVKAVVEGANIFFTEEARTKLQEHGILMFKDSSANKCGVICSSFEIISSLILEPEEFLEIKDVYVDQVIVKLRQKANLEARLMLREYHERGGRLNLVEISKVVSSVINRLIDLVSASLDHLTDEEFLSPMNKQTILNYVPVVLKDRYEDRILADIPRSYQQALISADTAARLVYTEGINFFEHLADRDVVKVLEIYLEKERELAELLASLKKTKIKNKDEIARVLESSGARTLTQFALQST